MACKPNFMSLADFGANDGGTSTFLWQFILEKLEELYPELPVWLHYEDQPTNDWKSLFLLTHGIASDSKISLKKRFKNLSVSCCGTSFYERCFPPGSLDLIYSATAMHWLSLPISCKIPDALHSAASKDKASKEIICKQAAKDWELNLLHRATELKSGGQMVLVNLAIDENNQFLGSTQNVPVRIFDKFYEIWSSLRDDDQITEEEFSRTCFANYYRTADEIRAPFNDENSPVFKAGLRLCSLEIKIVPCTYREFLKENSDMSSKEFAEWYVPTLRTWSNTTFFSALSVERSVEDRNRIVDLLFEKYRSAVEKNPQNHGMDYVHSHLHVEKL